MIRRSTILVLLALLVLGIPAFAQVQRGGILVKVADSQGAILPGVSVTLSSSILTGTITGITDEFGVYKSPTLGVGTYTVSVALPGFTTLNRENVVVTQNQTVTLDLVMQVGALNESVSVTAESPVVDTTSTNVNVNIDKKILESTPGGKDIWSLLEYKAPGIVFDTPDVGGNQGGLQRSLTARGTPNGQNTQLLNGVNVNDPAAQGFAMNYYVPTTFENVQVSTGSQDITVGTAGVVINMVSKSGRNRFFFQNLLTCQGHCAPFNTQSKNVTEPLLKAGLRRDANGIDYITNTNFQAGGPIIKDKLFYFGSFNYQPTHVHVVGFPAIAPTYIVTPLANTSVDDTTDILAGDGKINFQLNAKNRFEVYLSKQRYDKPNRGANSTTTQESDSKELDTFVIAQAAWNAILNDKLSADTRLSYNNTHFPLLQKTNLQPITDNTTNILYRNRTSSAMMFRRRLQVVSNWQYYLPRFAGGRHAFKFGVDNGYTPEDVTTTRVDDVNLTFTSNNGAPVRVTLFNSPTLVKRAVNTTAFYGQDSYSISRLTVIGGMRWERIEGFLPAQSHLTSKYFGPGTRFNSTTFSYTLPNGQAQTVTGPYTVPEKYEAVREDPLWKNFAGRASATFDLSGKGTTVIKSSFGKYLDQISTGTPPNPNGAISQQYVWNDINRDYIFQPGTVSWDGTSYVGGAGSELGAYVSGSQNLANPYGPLTFNKSLKRPSRNEYTLGVDHELIPNLLVSTTYIRRREKDVQGTVDQNPSLWNTVYTKVRLTEPGPDGLANTADDNPIEAYSLNSGQTITSITVNDDRLAQRYDGIEIAVTKRYSKGWTALFGYDYGKTRQDILGLNNPNNAYVNADGVSGGRRHLFNGSASYDLPWAGINVGTQFRVQSGLPITRTWTPAACSATVTTNCLNQQNQSINVVKRGSSELPVLASADVRIGKTITFEGHKFDLSLDAYNVTNAATVFSVGTSSTTRTVRYGGDATQPLTTIANWMSPTGVLGPRILRLNLTYSFGQ